LPKHREKILLSWSGGKDSAMALWELRKAPEYEVVGLLAALTEEDHRITMHGTPAELIEAQADALGLPLECFEIPRRCSNTLYLQRFHEALARYREQGIMRVAFGDLYLDDIRDFREEALEAVGMEAIFPLWHRETKELCYAFLNAKFKAVVTCVAEGALAPEFAGRNYDRGFLADLPLSVDPCGENGEFHTFVYDGPNFAAPIPLKLGKHAVCADRFHFCELAKKTVARKARSP
jgi:uncharacterized protein (TIGR00290 family)